MKSSAVANNLKPEKNATYRYDTSGRWYKGSLHLHTKRSDGHLSLDEVAHKYAQERFDFIAITDHWSLPEFNDKRESLPLSVIPGIS